MRLRDLVIGVLIFSGLTVGIMIFYEQTASLYVEKYPNIVGTFSSNETFAKFNRTQDIIDITDAIETKFSDIAQGFDITTVYDVAVLGFNVFSLLFKIPEVVLETYYNAMSVIHVPGLGWFTSMVSTIILVIIIFTVAGLFLKGKI